MASALECVEVIGVEKLGGYDVYDIEVNKHHNFFAGKVNVHNSSDPKQHWGR
jgi:intein/homing endonuclease